MSNMSPFRRPLRSLWRENAGASLIELGLALPLLMLMLLGMVDISRVVSNTIDVEQSAQRVTDFALAVRPASSSTTYLVNEAKRFIDTTTDTATITLTLECDGVSTSFNTVCADGTDTARMASVTIRRKVTFLFNWGAFASYFGGSSLGRSTTVQGDSVVRFQ